MAWREKKTEGGQGGKLGHSGMTHWEYTAHIKASARKVRRWQGKQVIKKALDELTRYRG